MFDKHSPEYIANGIYKIAGIRFSTLWAYKKSCDYLSALNNAAVNKIQSNQLSKLGYPSILTKPDEGYYEHVKAFPIESIRYFFENVVKGKLHKIV